MTIDYEIRLADSFGQHLQTFKNFGNNESTALDYVINVGKPGALNLVFPRGVVNESLFKVDGRIGVWRSIHGRPASLDGESVYLIRKWSTSRDYFRVTAYHANSLLKRRFVLYDKSTIYSDKSAGTPGDDLIKEIWSENFGPGIVPSDRDGTTGCDTRTDISDVVSQEIDLSEGVASYIQAGRRQVDSVVEEICNNASSLDSYITAEIVSVGTDLQLKTYVSQRGVDRRFGTSGQVIFSEDTGTLEDVELVIDRSEEVTVVCAAGAGDDDLRVTAVACDTDRIGDSAFNRIEMVIEESNIDDTDQLQSLAEAELQKHRPVILLTGTIAETGRYIRGMHYDVGDLVTVVFDGQKYDCRIDMCRVYIGHLSQKEQLLLRNI